MAKWLMMLTMMAGCAVSDEVTPIGDSFEGTWDAEVARAAQEWTDVGCPIFVTDSGTPATLVGVGEFDFDRDDEPLWGYYTGDEILIRDSLAPENRHRILLHEMGHMLGFEHSDHGIMRPHVAVDFVTADDCH